MPPQRMQAAGLDGIEFEAYGHLIDHFWSPATNQRDDDYGGSLDNRLRFTFDGARRGARARSAPDFIVGIRMVADEDCGQAAVSRRGGHRDRAAARRLRAWSISSTSSAAISTPTRR